MVKWCMENRAHSRRKIVQQVEERSRDSDVSKRDEMKNEEKVGRSSNSDEKAWTEGE